MNSAPPALDVATVDMPVVRFGDGTNDGQAEPEMLAAAGPVVRSSEALEDRLAVRVGHAGPGVTDPEFQRVTRQVGSRVRSDRRKRCAGPRSGRVASTPA